MTRSPASAGRCDMMSLLPLRPAIGGCREILPTPSMSLAVSTAITPGMFVAPDVSMLTMRAKACGERTKYAKAWFGSGASAI